MVIIDFVTKNGSQGHDKCNPNKDGLNMQTRNLENKSVRENSLFPLFSCSKTDRLFLLCKSSTIHIITYIFKSANFAVSRTPTDHLKSHLPAHCSRPPWKLMTLWSLLSVTGACWDHNREDPWSCQKNLIIEIKKSQRNLFPSTNLNQLFEQTAVCHIFTLAAKFLYSH